MDLVERVGVERFTDGRLLKAAGSMSGIATRDARQADHVVERISGAERQSRAAATAAGRTRRRAEKMFMSSIKRKRTTMRSRIRYYLDGPGMLWAQA